MPGTPKSKVKSRIIFTPQHAKRFMKALAENVQRYEAANGQIKDLEEVQLPPVVVVHLQCSTLILSTMIEFLPDQKKETTYKLTL